MKSILTIILCVILFIAIVLAIWFHEKVRNFKKVLKKAADERAARKMAEEDAYFKRTSIKNYREDDTPKFKDDYFKSADEEKPKPKQEEPKKEATARRTTTDSGVTIIDDRSGQQADKKIFDDNEGEYVDYVEVKS